MRSREYNRGFYEAMDRIMNWMQSQDDQKVKTFRAKLYGYCLDAKP